MSIVCHHCSNINADSVDAWRFEATNQLLKWIDLACDITEGAKRKYFSEWKLLSQIPSLLFLSRMEMIGLIFAQFLFEKIGEENPVSPNVTSFKVRMRVTFMLYKIHFTSE